MNPRKIVIVDYLSGWSAGGHAEDYLEVLIKVTSKFNPIIEAPFFRNPYSNSKSVWQRLCRIMKMQWRIAFYLRSSRSVLLVFHCPLFWDIVFLTIGAMFSKRRGRALLFLRRDIAWHACGDGVKINILRICLNHLAKVNAIDIVSDSKPVLEYWRRQLGMTGMYIPVPIREDNIVQKIIKKDSINFGLIGMFRIEKGARVYFDIISGLLQLFASSIVHCQISHTGNSEENDLAKKIAVRFGAHPRVRLYNGHLPKTEYECLLRSVDLVLLPYDINAYQGGSSGVFGEAIGAGAYIISTKISWALDEFKNHHSVFWANDNAAESMLKSVVDFTNYEQDSRLAQNMGYRKEEFSKTWCRALLVSINKN